MDTFGEFFGFDGRLDRTGYLWRSVVMVAVVAALAGGAIWVNTYVLDPDGLTGGAGLDSEILTGAFLLGLWSSFALTTRRLRDIGFEPAHIVPLYAAFWVINAVLLEPMSRLDPRDFAGLEGAWVALQWVAAIPLLLWPTSTRQLAAPAEYARPEPTAVLNWRESA
jgi:uncharacterized membrane protein YhaH (DUF805 family)